MVENKSSVRSSNNFKMKLGPDKPRIDNDEFKSPIEGGAMLD